MAVSFLQVDAFTREPFKGNPAAVCILPQAVDETWMQGIAAEMNLSETAFLYPVAATPEAGYHLRWFTPSTEVDLCGHATLASAHGLWSEGYLPPTAPAQFHTRSGLLTATWDGEWITLNFPCQPVTPLTPDPILLKALHGQELTYVGIHRGSNVPSNGGSDLDSTPIPEAGASGGHEGNYLVELTSEAHVRSLQPDFSLLATLPVMGVIVTSPSDDPAIDFVSRYFAPAVGINEDPVTGSAHCSLTPYWQEKLGKTTLLAHQVSSRGGLVKVTSQGDRVLIGGQAVTVLKGEILADPPYPPRAS